MNEAQVRAIHDGLPVTVQHKRGMSEQVTVKHLTVRQISEYIRVQEDEGAIIKLVTGKDDQWVDGLTPESALTLLQIADEVNRDFLQKCLLHRTRRLEAVDPNGARKLRELMGYPSSGGSPESASAPA